MDQSPAAAAQRLAYNKRALISAVRTGDTETVVDLLDGGVPVDTKDDKGMSLLHWAAWGSHVTTMRLLIKRGCDVDSVNGRGHTALHLAGINGRTKAVRELIRKGASKSVVASNYGTPLHQAAIKGRVVTALVMLEEGCPLDIVTSDGATVLHFAAAGGNVELVKELVDRGGDVNAVNATGHTTLHYAAEFGRTEVVCELIKLGANKSVLAGNYGTPLHQAARKGHVEAAVVMLEEGCPLDVVTSDGATVLHFAAAGGNVKLVKEMVDRGGDINAVKANSCTPLHDAAECGKTEAVCELIKLGASKSVVAGTLGTPLHRAALKGHVETAVAMLEEGCHPDEVTSAGVTVLHAAAKSGHVELVKELVGRGSDVNGMQANGCTPLHAAAGSGKTEALCELIKLGANKSFVAGKYGTPLHQAIGNGHLETVGALLEGGVSEPELASHDVTPSKAQALDSGIIGICDLFDQTPVMWALRSGQVEVLKLLISKGGAISDRDTHSLSVFEHCFLGGQANKLNQFCEACGIRSSEKGLRGVLTTLITQGLVNAHKVLSLCAISGDSVFLEDQFTELVASDACAMSDAVKCSKYCFDKGVQFINELNIADENALNPLQMALLSLKCYEMGFAIGSVQQGAKDHTSFITKLLSHPVLKKTVHENFPNGLSPLDLARQFELHHVAALIEGAGGRPGVWADIPRDVFLSYCSKLFTIHTLLKEVCDTSQGGHEAMKMAMIKILDTQTVERSPPSYVLTKEQDGLWHPNAIIVGADVGAERDDHAYKSLRECTCVDDVSDLVAKCNIDINAMLNHSDGGSIHLGIGRNGIVEEGLDLEKNEVISELRNKVGKVLRRFWPPVDSSFVQVEPVDLKNEEQELTGRWRFNIVVKWHPTVVQLAHDKSGYYRHGAENVLMTYDVFVDKIRAESARRRGPKESTDEGGRVPEWDANAAATVGANVGAERYDHEYKSLMGPVGGVSQPASSVNSIVNRVGKDTCRKAINAMLNSTGGTIHFGIYDNGIVQVGLDLEQSEAIDRVQKKVGDVLRNFRPQVNPSFVEVGPVNLKDGKQVLTGRWRFDIVVKPHPRNVVQLSENETAYFRWGPKNAQMSHDELAERVRCEPADQLPHGY